MCIHPPSIIFRCVLVVLAVVVLVVVALIVIVPNVIVVVIVFFIFVVVVVVVVVFVVVVFVVVVFVVVFVVVDFVFIVVVVVVTTPRSRNFPYFRTVRGVRPAKSNGIYTYPPCEAPLSGSLFIIAVIAESETTGSWTSSAPDAKNLNPE